MPTMSISTSVAANATSPNVLRGELFEFLSQRSAIDLFVSAAAAGILINYTVGGVQQVTGGVAPATNRYPVRPDDGVNSIGGLPGEQLFLTYQNTTGAAIVVQTLVDVNPI